jgi:DNA-directed RNA polymerase sigma subunit (sigma70/sigma32)
MGELYLEGYSLREVGLRAGVSMQRVHQILTDNKVKMRPKCKGMDRRPEERIT